MNDNSLLKGIVSYKLFDEQGNLKASGQSENVITTQGSRYYVDQLSDVGGAAARLMYLGTGASTPGTTDTWITGYFANNGTAAGTAGSATVATNSGTPASLQYIGTFSAGYATQATDPITNVGIANMAASANGNGTPNATTTFFISHGTLNPSTTKAAGDSLIITWDHLFTGS